MSEPTIKAEVAIADAFGTVLLGRVEAIVPPTPAEQIAWRQSYIVAMPTYAIVLVAVTNDDDTVSVYRAGLLPDANGRPVRGVFEMTNTGEQKTVNVYVGLSVATDSEIATWIDSF